MDERFFTLLFTYPKDAPVTSKIIKARLNTDYSHVCGVVSTGPIGLFDVYEASHGNVHGVDLTEFLKKNKVIKTCRIKFSNREDYYSLIRYLKKQRGKDYSEWGAVASTFKCLRKLGIGDNGDDKFICSEYMARALEEAYGMDYSYMRRDTDYIDPAFFEKILKQMKHQFYNGLHLPEYKGQ